jgi:hypothetical protein
LGQNIITPKIARTIIYGLVQETLFDLLNLHQGSFIFNLGTALVPQGGSQKSKVKSQNEDSIGFLTI